jgi:hypothetical protein
MSGVRRAARKLVVRVPSVAGEKMSERWVAAVLLMAIISTGLWAAGVLTASFSRMGRGREPSLDQHFNLTFVVAAICWLVWVVIR